MSHCVEGREAARRRGLALLVYFLVSWAALVCNASWLASDLPASGPASAWFFAGALVDSCFEYLLVASVPVLLAHGLVAWIERRRGPRRTSAAFVYGLALLATSAVQIALYADRRIFEIFGFHVNGFVVNLVLTPGGIDSMGGDRATAFDFGLLALAFAALQATLLGLAVGTTRGLGRPPSWLRPRALAAGLAALVALTATERLGYAVSHLVGYTPVLDAAAVLPLYQPLTIRHFARSLGFAPAGRAGDEAPHFRVASDRLHYPLRPLERGPHRRYNVVWLVSESLRADMVDPEIMPSTWAFAKRSVWFRDHYSGGNGTRMGMFSMFYGLYGSYWFPFLQHRREPVLLDVLQEDGYQLGLYTSAEFTYPEFDKTIFASVPADELHAFRPGEGGAGWQRDRRNVTDLLRFIDERDPSRPFMTFLFFESPHARYYFPPESVIRRPYLQELSYATMDLDRDIGLIFNRYVNACHHLDSQLDRVFRHLEERGLLDSTIVVVTGDHGEAFMEKGRWGHGSDFSEEQTRVPLVLWVPGESPREVTRMTSHLDLPATVLARLGVKNPPSDYSEGFDLLGDRQRHYTVAADWNNLAVIGRDAKVVFPFKATGFLQRRHATTADDVPLPEDRSLAVLRRDRDRWLEVMHELARFNSKG